MTRLKCLIGFGKRRKVKMNSFSFGIVWGFFFYTLFEPFLINLVYFSNVDLFLDIIFTKKNRNKLIKCVEERCMNKNDR